jgi:hypothetical protein
MSSILTVSGLSFKGFAVIPSRSAGPLDSISRVNHHRSREIVGNWELVGRSGRQNDCGNSIKDPSSDLIECQFVQLNVIQRDGDLSEEH